MNTVLPLLSSIVAFVFAVTVLDQFLARRKPYQLVWAISLFVYFISTGTELWTGMWVSLSFTGSAGYRLIENSLYQKNHGQVCLNKI